MARMGAAGHRDLRGLLVGAGLDRETADRDLRELHHRRVLLLVDAGEDADGLAEVLDGAAAA